MAAAARQILALLASEAARENGQPILPPLARKHLAIDHTARLATMLNLDYRFDVCSAVAGKALVGPA
ncbi:hypothetical protein, partial [Mesorhizobium sp. M7A.F.Ca.US.006.04.2.1]|uniref:hypothetical protein n=1 Tax=Mesorhizobium sp. M7A.F.Ca.US.006.04.2.1 TaxID=2496696 RepID=UPI0019D45557